MAEVSKETQEWLKAMEVAEERGLPPPEPSEAVKLERGIITEPEPEPPEPPKIEKPPEKPPEVEKPLAEPSKEAKAWLEAAEAAEERGIPPPPMPEAVAIERGVPFEPKPPVEEKPPVKPPEEKPPAEPSEEAKMWLTAAEEAEERGLPPPEMPEAVKIERGIIPPPFEEPEPELEVPPEPVAEPPTVVEPRLLTREEKREYEAASPEEQFELAVGYGYVPEGSEYTPPFTEEQAAELLPKLVEEFGEEEARKELPPVVGWGYYTPEQIKRREEATEARQAWARTTILRSRELAEAADVFEKQLREQTPDLHRVYTEKGPEAYNQYIKDNYTELPDGQWMSNESLAVVKEQSQYGYNIVMDKGYSAYQDAIVQALKDVEKFKTWPEGYRLRRAYTQGVSEDTLSLIFSPEDVAKATRRIYVPKEEEKVTSTLPPSLLGILPVGGAVAIAEPTIAGELILGLMVLGGVAVVAMQGKEISFTALMDEIKKTFSSETGRPATTEEIAQMETMATNVIQGTLIPATAVQIESGSPPLVPPRVEWGLTTPPITVVDIPTGTKLIPPKVDWGKTTPPITAVDIKTGTIILPAEVEEIPQLIMAQTAVQTAVKELEDVIVIIRPVVLDPGKFPLVTVTKTETALVALDKAVQDAYVAGEIDADVLRIYAKARENYLTKKQILDATSQAYIGGMQPQLVSNVQNLTALAFVTATNDLMEKANQAATDAYNKAITEGMTQTQAETAAQTASQSAIQEATQTAIQTAVQEATQTAVVTDTATITAVQTATQTAVNTAVQAITQTAVQTATAIEPVVLIPPPFLPEAVEVERKIVYPAGTIVWKMGFMWKIIPPPYTILKPLSSKEPPAGVTVLEGTPQETLQMIGKPKAAVPESISVDLGIVDVFITERGRSIQFGGGGLETDVGMRLPSPAKGMSIPAKGVMRKLEAEALGEEESERRGKRAKAKQDTTPSLKEIR